MNTSLIIILAAILLILVVLNHITIITTTTTTTEKQASCAQTAFGCCPDGVNSKINFYGTNCPKYNPGPGYSLYPPPPPPLINKRI